MKKTKNKLKKQY